MIQIREGIAADAAFIVKSQLEMAKETEGMALDLQTVEKGVDAVFKNSAHGKYYVAQTVSGDYCGCLLTIPEWSDWRNGQVIWIHSVYILPAFRRQGVYREMYNHLKKKVVEEPGLRGLRLYVERKNERAQKAYQNLGMDKEHYEMYEWLK